MGDNSMLNVVSLGGQLCEFDSAKLCFNMHHAAVLMRPGLTESSTIKSESMSLC